MRVESKTGAMNDFRKNAGAKKVLHRMTITKTDGGKGRHVTHEMKNDEPMGMYQAPVEHSFGPGQGKEFMAHMQQHMGMEDGEEPESAAEEKKEAKGKGGKAAAEAAEGE